MDSATPLRRITAEALGSLFLLAGVVGSGIMGETLSPENDGVALLGNTIATGALLVVLIRMLDPISGAHFNPAVTLMFWHYCGAESARAWPSPMALRR
jgi:glycerol uptake facilitator-like aquaporin